MKSSLLKKEQNTRLRGKVCIGLMGQNTLDPLLLRGAQRARGASVTISIEKLPDLYHKGQCVPEKLSEIFPEYKKGVIQNFYAGR